MLFWSCQGNNKMLKSSIESEFKVPVEVAVQGNDIVVVLPTIPEMEKKSPFLTDYRVSSIVRNVLNTLGKSDFEGFNKVRVDVASLRRSYDFPTKEYVLGIGKLSFVQETVKSLNQKDEAAKRKIFDESITKELFEEQILKEWNELLQWNGEALSPAVIGVKVLQLPSEVGYFLQIGVVQTNRNGESALIEFLFESNSKKVLGVNITYL